VLHSVSAVTDQVLRLVLDGQVATIDGTIIDVPVESICLHGDTPDAVNLAVAIRASLEGAGVTITSFV
jgi:UPF0271 protein